MNTNDLIAGINHPVTALGLGMLMLAAPYVNNAINETEFYGIPASNLIFVCGTLKLFKGLSGCAHRFFSNRMHLRAPEERLENLKPVVNASLNSASM